MDNLPQMIEQALKHIEEEREKRKPFLDSKMRVKTSPWCIDLPNGITVYYIDFKKKANRAMGIKTIAANKQAYKQQLRVNQRINLKSAYGFLDLFDKLHLINMQFTEKPYQLID